MNRMFYFQMALTNLKKNKQTYGPYLITCIVTLLNFFIFRLIANNPGLSEIPGSDPMKVIFGMGTWVIGIFSAIFLFYTNSFLMKRRQKELGLYAILGLEKKHIGEILFYEMLCTMGITLLFGLLGGVVLGKLFFLILLKFLDFKSVVTFHLTLESFSLSTEVFVGIFIVIFISNLIRVQLARPIELLKGEQVGEREPKASVIVSILGVLALSAGYVIANVVESPLTALGVFFVAVLLVILGTYLLFTTGSIAFLKHLKKNKKYYYREENFISVSGMIYRMKKNAVGLSNICILSTMVLITIATTLSLYMGKEDMLRGFYPYDLSVQLEKGTTLEKDKVKAQITKALSVNGIKEVNAQENHYYAGQATGVQENELQVIKDTEAVASYKDIKIYKISTLDEYNRLTNASVSLEANDILLYTNHNGFHSKTLKIGDAIYNIKEKLKKKVAELGDNMDVVDFYDIVVKDETAKEKMIHLLTDKADEKAKGNEYYTYQLSLEGKKEQITKTAAAIKSSLEGQDDYVGVTSYYLMRAEWNRMYGTFLFIGLFLGLLFMMGAVLIIYFKQVAEGYEDHDRFKIMNQVGMGDHEIKMVIRKQIIMVFFMPLITALIHTGAAYKLMTRLLKLFGLTNTALIAFWMVIIALIFSVLYIGFYLWTAKTYYKLVRQ